MATISLSAIFKKVNYSTFTCIRKWPGKSLIKHVIFARGSGSMYMKNIFYTIATNTHFAKLTRCFALINCICILTPYGLKAIGPSLKSLFIELIWWQNHALNWARFTHSFYFHFWKGTLYDKAAFSVLQNFQTVLESD